MLEILCHLSKSLFSNQGFVTSHNFLNKLKPSIQIKNSLYKSYIINDKYLSIIRNKNISVNFYQNIYQYYKNPCNQRLFHQSSSAKQLESDKNGQNERILPKIFYYQNPFVWLRNKFNFYKLRNTWDPNFNEVEFTRGSKQAVSLITQIISNDEFDSLEGLLTKKAIITVRKEVVLLWKDEVKRHIALGLDDIQLAVPTKIQFNRLEKDTENKICDIDMWFMALKWVEDGALLIIDIATRFNRNYAEENLSDWTISIFQVRRFHVRHPRQ